MNKSIALIFAASTLFLAGCCTAPHAAKWEYKVASAHPGGFGGANTSPPSPQEYRDRLKTFLDDIGKDGWALVCEDNGTFYFKRPVK